MPGFPFSASETCEAVQPRVLAVSTEVDAIAFDHACLLGRRVWEDTLDGDEALDLADLHADAAILPPV